MYSFPRIIRACSSLKEYQFNLFVGNFLFLNIRVPDNIGFEFYASVRLNNNINLFIAGCPNGIHLSLCACNTQSANDAAGDKGVVIPALVRQKDLCFTVITGYTLNKALLLLPKDKLVAYGDSHIGGRLSFPGIHPYRYRHLVENMRAFSGLNFGIISQ